jgi:hypothetical protein
MSLRQKQINEILGYHDNINRDVFEREKKHVYYSGLQELQPRERDLVVEAEVKQRIQSIQYDIQNIAQGIHYIPSGTMVKTIASAYALEEGDYAADETTGDLGINIEPYKPQRELSTLSREKSGKENFDRILVFLTKLVRDWNNLVDYLTLKTQQNRYSDAQEASLKDGIAVLLEPIKELLEKVVLLKSQTQDYYKIYNTIKALYDCVSNSDLTHIPQNIMSDTTPVVIEDMTSSERRQIKDKIADYNIRIDDIEMMKSSDTVEADAISRLKMWYTSERAKLQKLLTGKKRNPSTTMAMLRAVMRDPANDRAYEKIIKKIKPKNREIIESKEERPERESKEEEPYGRSEYGKSREAPESVRRFGPYPPRPRSVTSEASKPRDKWQTQFIDEVTKLGSRTGLSTAQKDRYGVRIMSREKMGFLTEEEADELIKMVEAAPSREEGEGKPSRKKGGAVPLGNFPDEATLAPYISKHLKPSRFKNTKIADDTSSESGSDTDSAASSSEDEAKGGRKKRGGAKPVITNSPDKDLWFL